MFEVNIGRECLEIDSRLNSADFRELPLCYFASLLRRRCLYLQHALIQLNHIHKLLKLLWLPRRPHVCTAAAQISTGRGLTRRNLLSGFDCLRRVFAYVEREGFDKFPIRRLAITK